MRILVTKTTRAAPDGVTVRSYRAGETAEMPEDLARVFLREGWGREANAPAMEAAPANKAQGGAPETKTLPDSHRANRLRANPLRAKRRRRRRRRKRAPARQ